MSVSTTLPDEIKPVLENGVPCILATCSKAGEPNVTIVSQAYYVDPSHVAISFQFFSKTVRNVRENRRARLTLSDIPRVETWDLELEYERSETSGPLFEAMDMEIEAIASASGMSGIFALKSADVYRVKSVRKY